MTKFTKITSAALLALFLAACDKAAEKKAEAPAQNTQTQQETAKEPEKKAEEAKPAEAAKPAETTKASDPAAEYQMLSDWGQAQQIEMQKAGVELRELASRTRDMKQLSESIEKAKNVFADSLKNLDKLEIKDEAVAALRSKSREVLVLMQEALLIGTKIAAEPEKEAEYQQEAKGITMKLLELAPEMQKMDAELRQRFGIK